VHTNSDSYYPNPVAKSGFRSFFGGSDAKERVSRGFRGRFGMRKLE
jgi:hypothetical protein